MTNKNILLIDFSAITVANVLEFEDDIKNKSAQEMKGLLYHTIIKSIVSYKKKFPKYPNVVIAADSRHSWRKDFFPLYKANRKEKREQDTLDWNAVFEVIGQLENDIETMMPWKLMKVDKCEADDIIATVVKMNDSDFSPPDILIISSDKDFVQLHKYNNVRQISTKTKTYMQFTKTEIAEKTIEHIVKGDSSDGVCNILSEPDSLANKVRQKSVFKARLDAFIKNGRDECKTDFERDNWDRNYTLVNFDAIPEHIVESVVNKYNMPQTGNKGTAMTMFHANALRNLIHDLQDL